MPARAAADSRVLALCVEDQRFGVPAELVREVARMPRLARVPHAPAAVMGLANVRGAVLPVLSLATLLRRTGGAERRIVVVDAGQTIGLAVEDVGQLVQTGQPGEAGVQPIDIDALIADTVKAMPARKARGGVAIDAEVSQEALADTVALVVVAVGRQEFALPLGIVEEVLRLPADMAVLPHADAVILGTMSHRGTLLPLLSLRELLALQTDAAADKPRVIVTRIGKHRVGLVVDAVRSIARVGEDRIDAIPQVLSRGQAEARIQAICRLDDGERLVSVLAPDHLLRDDITARLYENDGGDVAEMAETGTIASSEQFLLFRIGEDEFGLPIGAVEEIAALPAKLTRLPRAPAFVRGVMNLRGQVVPVIDQAQRFGSEAEAGRKRRVVVVRIGDLQAGFVVDAVSEVLRVEQSALRPAPDLGGEETRMFERVATFPDQQRIVLIVSPEELLSRAEQDLLRALGRKAATAKT